MSYRDGLPAKIAADILVNLRQMRKHNSELTQEHWPIMVVIDIKSVSLEYASEQIADYDFNLLLDILGNQPDTKLSKITKDPNVRDVNASYSLTLGNKPGQHTAFESVINLKRYSLATT